MTKDEFQKRYHEYRTYDMAVANAEALKVNQEGIQGDSAVVVDFGIVGIGLMLKSAYDFAKELGVI